MRTLLLATCVSAGCMHVTSATINAPPHPMFARSSESVDRFSSGPPERAHVDVALLSATSGHFFSSLDDCVHAVLERAARMGCDGIVIGDSSAGRRLTATCIAYPDSVQAHVETNPDLDEPPQR